MKNLVLCVLAAFGLMGLKDDCLAAEKAQPNIIIFLVDDLGSHDVGFAGGKEIPTPSIDALAHDGMVLEQFYVMHVCSPTRAALMTGRHPIRYGLQTGVIRPNWAYGLALDERLLSNALHDSGYTTAILGKWHLGMFTREYLPTSRGFDFQYGNYCGAIDCFTKKRDAGYDWHRNDAVCRDEGYSTHQLTEEAIQWMEKADPQKPLLLYVPYNAVHAPLQAPEKYHTPFAALKGPRKNYAAMLAAVDESIGKIRSAADRLRGGENNIYFFSTDNGGPAPGKTTSNGILRAGKGTLYEGGLRSCAFMTWKGHIEAGKEEAEPLHIVDVYPTLLTLAGAKMEQAHTLDGRSFASLLLGNRTQWQTSLNNQPRPILLNAEANRGALRHGDWKIVIQRGNAAEGNGDDQPSTADNTPRRRNRQNGNAEQMELYNLANDPAEKNDLAEQQPAKLAELLKYYRTFEGEAQPALATADKKQLPTPEVWGEWERTR